MWISSAYTLIVDLLQLGRIAIKGRCGAGQRLDVIWARMLEDCMPALLRHGGKEGCNRFGCVSRTFPILERRDCAQPGVASGSALVHIAAVCETFGVRPVHERMVSV